MIKFSILLFLSIPVFIFSQENAVISASNCASSLEGKILDDHDNSPLELAAVYIVELKLGATTKSNGKYYFSGLCDGLYTLRINHFDCEPIELKVTVKGKTIKNVYPEHHSEELSEVAISAKRLELQTTQTKNEVSAEKLEQSKGQSLGETLKSIPGVNTLNTGNSISKPVIHGLHSNRILILNNGIRQEGQQWGVEHAPEIDPLIAGKLSVVKGANSVRYGSDALGGVVLVETKPLRTKAGINGEVNAIGMSNGRAGTFSAYLDGNFAKLSAFSWRIQGTLKQNGTLATPNYNLVNTGLKEYNFSYTLGWQKRNYNLEVFYSQFNTTLGIFSGSHIGNLTDLEKAFESDEPLVTGDFTYAIDRPYQHIEHELYKTKFDVLTGRKGKLSIVYARQYNLRYEYDKFKPLNDSLADLNRPELQFELTSHTTDVVWEHNSINRFTGSIGLSGITQGNTYEGRALIPNFRNYSGGLFWIERYRTKKWEIEAGVRYDYKQLQVFKYEFVGNGTYELIKPIHRFENVTANLGTIYKIDSALNVSLHVGSAWRAPSVSELYSSGLHQGAAAVEYGNSSLGSEIAYTGNLTLRYSPSDKLFLEFSPYYNYISNYIYRKPTPEPILTIRGAFPGFNYVQTDAVFKGIDGFLNYKFTPKIELTTKASILRAWNKTEKVWLIMVPSDRYETELTYRFKDHKKRSNSYVSSALQYVTKQTRVPENSDFVAPPPAYFLIQFHIASSFSLGKQKIEIGISVFNALNTRYRDYLDRFRYFSDAPGRSINVRLKIPFGIIKK